MSRLKEQYQNEIVDALTKKFGYKNIMEVPKLDKVVINMGVGEAKDNAKLLDSAIADMEKITGQKAVICRAKKSVANFKLREGMAIGCKVTLRGEKMYEFVDRLINLALPRVRDFRGVNPNAFDGRGNYALGIKEQLIFPEIEYDKVDKVRGMDIVFVTTAKTDEEARELLLGVDRWDGLAREYLLRPGELAFLRKELTRITVDMRNLNPGGGKLSFDPGAPPPFAELAMNERDGVPLVVDELGSHGLLHRSSRLLRGEALAHESLANFLARSIAA